VHISTGLLFLWCPVSENISVEGVHQVASLPQGKHSQLAKQRASSKSQSMEIVQNKKAFS